MTTLYVGVGASSSATPEELATLLRTALARVPGEVAALATLSGKETHPAIAAAARALRVPILTYPAAALATIAVPTPAALPHLATPSVAEAAALLAASPTPHLALPKQKGPHTTLAIATPEPPAGARGTAPPQEPQK